MSSKDQKSFESFMYFGPSKFNGILGEDLYEFLIDYYDKLHNLGSL